jgi:hypothetical protein
LATAAPLHGQRSVNVGLDVGGAIVRYDGFLSSGAASITPTLRLATPHTTLDARASSLFFQSGRSSVSGDVDGSWLAASSRTGAGLRLEASAGGSQYATSYRYAYGLAGVRLVVEPRGGPSVWLAGRGGASGSSTPRDVADPLFDTGAVHASMGAAEASMGIASHLRAASLRAELRAERVGAERLAEGTVAGAWNAGRLAFDARAGARRARLDDVRAFAEGGATVRVNERLGVSLHAGRYASDPLQGIVAGRFAELTAHFSLGAPRRAVAREPAMGAFTRLGFDVRLLADGGRELRFRVPGAARVEIMADFTNWQPVVLRAVGDERWALTARLPPGVHRVNVRIDGGAWTVPPGLTAVADEFGGAVGLLIVE